MRMRCHAAKAVIALRLVYNFMRASSLGCLVSMFYCYVAQALAMGRHRCPTGSIIRQ